MNIHETIQQCERSVISEWAKGDSSIKSVPWLVYIGVTNRCNSRCRVCAHSKAMRKEKGNMSIDTFRRIVDQLPHSVKKVYLMKQGEPLLNPNLEECIKYLRHVRPDVYIAFHTNGIVARKDRMEKIFPLLDALGISISATTPDTYTQVHGVDKFDVVTQNISDMSDLLLGMNEEKKPHVFIDYIYQRANAMEEEQEVVQYFSSHFPGLSSVDFHCVYNFQGETEEGNLQIYDELAYDQFPCCVFPWSSITFCHDGKVSYCFVEPRENRFLGDITRQSFEDIWNGEEYRRFRERMAHKEFDMLAEDGFYCHKCAWLWSMKSQSPRNLSGGYASQNTLKQPEQLFGDVLEMPHEQLFAVGSDYYLEGEIHQAIGCFNLLLMTNKNESILQNAEKMLTLCQQVLKKYEHLALWQEMLQNEGHLSQKRACRYYSNTLSGM